MAMGFNAEYVIAQSAGNVNLNSTSSQLEHFLRAGGNVRRAGVVAEAAEGLLAAMVLTLEFSVDGGANFTTIATLSPAGALARGVNFYKDVPATSAPGVGATAQKSAGAVPPNSLVRLRVSNAAGGTSTGRLWIELEEQPFNGVNVPANAVAAA
jgi:hypothetical protein